MSWRPFRHALALALGMLAWLSAGYLWQLQNTLGPGNQHVNVRFAPETPADVRHEFERRFGLTAGVERDSRTWMYLLTDRSRDNIRGLFQSPLVEDTAHLDRTALRVTIDRPGMQPWLRELVEAEWLPYGAGALTLLGLVLAWSARRSAVGWARAGATQLPRLLKAAAARGPTLIDRHEAAFYVGVCALFLVPVLLYGPSDDEELGLGVFSSQIYYRDLLLHGRWSYWLTDVGFGTPMPLGQRLDFHPVFALGSLVSLRVALSAVWIVQTGLMTVYFRRLLALWGLAPGVRLAFFALYLFSVPTFMLLFTSDWLSCVVPWMLYPVLVYYLRDAVMGGAATRWWLTTVRLGLLLSVWVLNAHPGYLVPLFVVLAAYTLAAARPTLAVYGAIAAAGALAFAASAERIYFLFHEQGFFPPEILKQTQGGYLTLAYIVALASPLMHMSDMRQPFTGTFVFVAAAAAPVLWRTADRHLRGCIVAFFVALALSLTPVDYLVWSGISGGWLFRDPMVFFGLLSAAAVMQAALRVPRVAVQRTAMALLLLQGLQQIAVIGPGYREYRQSGSSREWYRHQEHPIGVAAAVVRAANRYGKRVYLSPRATDLSRGHLSSAGVHVATDFALLGLNPVNAWFKNVSMDRIHPSWIVMHGIIRGQRTVVDNATLRDVLGIDVVVAISDEGFAPSGLTRLDRVWGSDEAQVDIFGNPDAWPEAVLLSPAARAAALPLLEGCEHTAALCRDFTALARTRLPGEVALRDLGDGYQLHVPPSDAPRVLFLSAFYRPEWVARAAGQTLAIEPIADAFIGVSVPPGVQDVELTFRPPVRVALTWVSWATLLAMLAALSALWWRDRAGPRIR